MPTSIECSMKKCEDSFFKPAQRTTPVQRFRGFETVETAPNVMKDFTMSTQCRIYISSYRRAPSAFRSTATDAGDGKQATESRYRVLRKDLERSSSSSVASSSKEMHRHPQAAHPQAAYAQITDATQFNSVRCCCC